MQKGAIGKILVYTGIILIIVWYAIFTIYIIKFPAIEQRVMIYSVYPWLLLALSFIIIVYGIHIIRSIIRETVGKVFKVEKLKRNGLGSIKHKGIIAYFMSSDDIKEGDYVKIKDIKTLSTGRSSQLILVAKKLDPSDPEYPVL